MHGYLDARDRSSPPPRRCDPQTTGRRSRNSVACMQRASAERPVCPGCGDPIGVYEPLWRLAAEVGAEQTSWLRLPERHAGIESLWHLECAEAEGVEGG